MQAALQRLGFDRLAGLGFDERHDLLAPPLAVAADHQRIGHPRVRAQHRFDLFDEDLLAAGVDHQ